MKRIFYLLVTLHLTLVTVSAQPSITWQRVYGWQGSDYANSVVETPDNGYIVTGRANFTDMFIMRLNYLGDTVWTRFFPWGMGVKIERTSDNNYIACSFYTHVVKIDINGNVLWSAGPFDLDAKTVSIKQSLDGGYILCGRRMETISLEAPYLLKINSLGAFEWDTSYKSGIFDGKFEDIAITEDNCCVMAGNYSDTNYITDKLFIMKTDLTGNQIWFRGYDTLQYLDVSAMIKVRNEAYVITGNWGAYNNLPYLAKIASVGTIQWFKLYYTFDPNFADFYSVSNTYDGGYALTGIWDSIGNFTNYILLFRTDSTGNYEWHKSFGFNDADGGYELRPTADSGFIIAGYRGRYNWDEIYIVKTNKNGFANPIGVKTLNNHIPSHFTLYQNFPNPFNPKTTIKYDIPHNSYVTFKVYDVLGKEIYSSSEFKFAGSYEVSFDGSNYASGLYFYRIEASDYVDAKKMLMIK